MSTETDKTAGEEPHGALYKATEIGLSVASVGAIILSFVPGVNLIGAVMQGGITLVQTGMDLATKGPKKAAWSFATGALLTAASVVPFLGGLGNIARGAEVVGEGAKVAEVAVESSGLLARAGRFFGRIKDGGVNLIKKIPGVDKVDKYVVQPISERVVAPVVRKTQAADRWLTETSVVKSMKGSRVAASLEKHKVGTRVLEGGLTVAGIGASMMGDTPPMSLANPDNYDFDARRQWRNRIEAERDRQAAVAQEH